MDPESNTRGSLRSVSIILDWRKYCELSKIDGPYIQNREFRKVNPATTTLNSLPEPQSWQGQAHRMNQQSAT